MNTLSLFFKYLWQMILHNPIKKVISMLREYKNEHMHSDY